MTTAAASEMARLGSYDLSALLIQGASKQNTSSFANDANTVIASIRESVEKSTAFAVNTDKAAKQNAANFASDAKAAITALKESVKSKNNLSYAVKGDARYDEDMDADSDGTVSYSEYIKYATKQGLEKYNLPTNSTTFSKLFDSETGITKPQILNLGKALNSYLTNSKILPQSLIQKEA